MSVLHFERPNGELVIHGWCVDTMRAASELGNALVDSGPQDVEIDFAGYRAHLEARPAPRGRYTRFWPPAHWLRPPKLPLLVDYENASWLIERHFQAPLPLAVGLFYRTGQPYFEYLLTRHEPGALKIATVLAGEGAAGRLALAREAAAELGRMHALGFRYRRLTDRSLLALPPGHGRRLLFRATRGGSTGSRGFAGGGLWPDPGERDLAQLLELGLFTDRESKELIEEYHRSRATQDRPLRHPASARRLARARAQITRASG